MICLVLVGVVPISGSGSVSVCVWVSKWLPTCKTSNWPQ